MGDVSFQDRDKPTHLETVQKAGQGGVTKPTVTSTDLPGNADEGGKGPNALQANFQDIGSPFYSQYHAVSQPSDRPTTLSIRTQQVPVSVGAPLAHAQHGYNPTSFSMGYMAANLPAYTVPGNAVLHPQITQQLMSGVYSQQSPASLYLNPPSLQQNHNSREQYESCFVAHTSPSYTSSAQSPQMYAPTQPFIQHGMAFHQGAYNGPRPQQPYGFQDHTGVSAASYAGRFRENYGSNFSVGSASNSGRFGTHSTTESVGTQMSSFDIKSQSSIPRGPPRKPRQSGHALWVGNLPPNATVTDLKDHFSREATKDIESVKLISKSNCAFVNYRTQAACIAAMDRFHDSRFHGLRLVCRLRRGASSTTGAASVNNDASCAESQTQDPDLSTVPSTKEVPATPGQPVRQEATVRMPQKFFVLKSLTLQDLELSSRNGVWATQTHNEGKLNSAYQMADNVYLIFSANKSGEYFGYARMNSPIPAPDFPSVPTPAQETPVQESTPTVVSIDAGPQSIPTPATEWAPKGKIIDDSARGTIFWEVDFEEHSPVDNDKTSESESGDASPDGQPLIASSSATYETSNDDATEDNSRQGAGNPFRVQWLSTKRIPFYRTRGLRNSWNSNREVKIARDGTELETVVGQRLLALFGPGGSPFSSVASPLP